MKPIFLTLILVLFVSCASTKKSESIGEYVDNSAISSKIKTKLISEDNISSTSIDVETYKGHVILSGFVDNEVQKQKALKLAKETKGVVAVKDALIVKTTIK